MQLKTSSNPTRKNQTPTGTMQLALGKLSKILSPQSISPCHIAIFIALIVQSTKNLQRKGSTILQANCTKLDTRAIIPNRQENRSAADPPRPRRVRKMLTNKFPSNHPATPISQPAITTTTTPTTSNDNGKSFKRRDSTNEANILLSSLPRGLLGTTTTMTTTRTEEQTLLAQPRHQSFCAGEWG